jgi:tetratricopeptide (TPR) repeat protein
LSFLLIIAAYLYIAGYWEAPEDPVPAVEEAADEEPPAAAAPHKKSEGSLTTGRTLPRKENPLPPIGEAREKAGAAAFAEAVRSLNGGDYGKALALFKKLSVDDKTALLGVGLSYFKLGDYESAIAPLEGALKHGGDEFLARKFLAFAYYRRDDLQRSAAHAERGLSLKEDRELRDLYDKLEAERAAQRDYVGEETRHFRVLFDGYEHGGLSRKVIEILTDAYRSIGREMDYFPEDPVTVILYTEKDFYDITHVHRWVGGAYDGKIRIPVRGAEGQEEALRRVLFHEYTHALVHSITPDCPLWINEGLADYFSGGGLQRTGQAISLRSIEKSFPASRPEAALAYRVSYSAVAHLIERYGVYSMKDFLVSLSRGEGLEQAFSSAFFLTYNEFVSGWGRG